MDTTRAMQAYCSVAVLYMAMELSAKKWVLLFGDGMHRPRRKSVEAGDLQAVQHEIALAKAKFGLPGDMRVISCYEAGRDGFWIHRWLSSIGVDNRVVDSASIEVPQRAKRVKTDRIDVEKLLSMLMRACAGERNVWRQVHVPTPEHEDLRRVTREQRRLTKEVNAAICRIRSLLATQGVRLVTLNGFIEQLHGLRCWDGSVLPAHLRAELVRQWQRLQLSRQQQQALNQQQQREATPQMNQLQRLKALGPRSAWTLCTELFGWREIANRRQVGALAGFTPTPYCSGSTERDQGISKAGIRPLRPATIELAWLWLRWQPDSALSRWYEQRFGKGSKRSRRIGIVALARKLLVALWRYLHDGLIPEGAVLKRA